MLTQLLHQLGVDQTFFIQFALVVTIFGLLSQFYFKPFLKLFEKRHERLFADQQAAQELQTKSEEMFALYQRKFSEARNHAKQTFDVVMGEARRQEAEIIGQTREETKRIIQQTQEQISREKIQLKADLSREVEGLAGRILEKILARKV